MAKAWANVRREALDSGGLDRERIAAARKVADEATRAYRLSEVRKAQSVSQTALAKVMHVTQARVSRIERGELSRAELGTLQAYVEALGGHLRVVADFGDQTITVE